MGTRKRTAAKQLLIELLIAARKKSGITQKDLAKKLSEPQSFISKVENGERRLDFVELVDYLEALGEDPRTFLQNALKKLGAK